MEFLRYQHIEKLGTTEVEGIELGSCYVFPKLDGTNSSIWLDNDGNIRAGSRNRELSLDNDNGGFYKDVLENSNFDSIKFCLKENPNLRFFGEYLIPHSLKTYKETAWKQFYVFDVLLNEIYLSYDEYKVICDKYNINYIPCIRIIKNGTYDDFIYASKLNDYLIDSGKGVGEGIVIKNYNFINKFQRTPWAKLVTSEFKEVHYKTMGSPEQENKLIEEDIANSFCTDTLVNKTFEKILLDLNGEWSSKMIPRLLETVFYELVKEESYEILKKFKLPTINFKTLKSFVIQRIKEVKPELF